jgi:hypothetical protein
LDATPLKLDIEVSKRSLWADTQRAALEASLEFLEPITAGTRKLFGGSARNRRVAPAGGPQEIVGPVQQRAGRGREPQPTVVVTAPDRRRKREEQSGTIRG